jgi:hypothetical protein
MLDFNLWTWNSRAFPGIDPLVVGKHDRVRIRVGNLTMTNHPIHLHGHSFQVTGTDGGWVQPSARWPEVTTDIGVGQMRAIEFVADNLGDWALHCHKSHHTMNAMGHQVPTLIGVEQDDLLEKIGNLVPDYMAMGKTGMAEMSEMSRAMKMPLPENTLPMMTGVGQFGAIDMGGMFSTLKVREGLARDDYKDPGAYRFPEGSVAYEFVGEAPAVQRPTMTEDNSALEVQVRKPTGHAGH